MQYFGYKFLNNISRKYAMESPLTKLPKLNNKPKNIFLIFKAA